MPESVQQREKIEGYYALEDRWVRKGDVLVMEDVEVEGGVKQRIVGRFYGFSPGGHSLDDAECPDNVAPMMAYMFCTMANDGFAALQKHVQEQGRRIHLVDPAAQIILPGRDRAD